MQRWHLTLGLALLALGGLAVAGVVPAGGAVAWTLLRTVEAPAPAPASIATPLEAPVHSEPPQRPEPPVEVVATPPAPPAPAVEPSLVLHTAPPRIPDPGLIPELSAPQPPHPPRVRVLPPDPPEPRYCPACGMG